MNITRLDWTGMEKKGDRAEYRKSLELGFQMSIPWFEIPKSAPKDSEEMGALAWLLAERAIAQCKGVNERAMVISKYLLAAIQSDRPDLLKKAGEKGWLNIDVNEAWHLQAVKSGRYECAIECLNFEKYDKTKMEFFSNLIEEKASDWQRSQFAKRHPVALYLSRNDSWPLSTFEGAEALAAKVADDEKSFSTPIWKTLMAQILADNTNVAVIKFCLKHNIEPPRPGDEFWNECSEMLRWIETSEASRKEGELKKNYLSWMASGKRPLKGDDLARAWIEDQYVSILKDACDSKLASMRALDRVDDFREALSTNQPQKEIDFLRSGGNGTFEQVSDETLKELSKELSELLTKLEEKVTSSTFKGKAEIEALIFNLGSSESSPRPKRRL